MINTTAKIKAELDDGSFDKDDKNTNQLLSLARRYCVENFNCQVSKGTDVSSYSNITAQYRMLVGECLQRGLINDVLSTFGGPGNAIFDIVCRDFGLQVQQTPPVQPTWSTQPQS